MSTTELVGDFLFNEVFRVDVLRYSVRGLLEAEGLSNVNRDEEWKIGRAERADLGILKREASGDRHVKSP